MTLAILGDGGKRRRKHRDAQPTSYTQPSNNPPTYPLNVPMAPPGQNQPYRSPPQYPVQPYLHPPQKSHSNLRDTLATQAGKSVTQLKSKASHSLGLNRSVQAINQGAALCDLISSKLDNILTSMDGECFSGKEQDLYVYESPETYPTSANLAPETLHRGQPANPVYPSSGGKKGSNYFSKVWLYTNSRLPPHLPPFKVYLPTWPLLCLAANYSDRVYAQPSTAETETHIPSDWRSGTKAMVLKSVPIDDMHTVVFSIRGSATFMDWAVNYKSAPSSPKGFLDDEGNLCHSGFLYVAKKMLGPVAERLKALLQENPSRSHCSLLITGHSAGGAVAALLYAHMMSTSVQSDLNHLTGFFKRVHCVTFGAPPVSLLPLQKPNNRRHRKSLFYGFINEGDPVPRADKQIVRSLLKLYASPAPNPTSIYSSTLASFSKLNLGSNPNPSNTTFQTASSKPSKTSKLSLLSYGNSKTSKPNSTATQQHHKQHFWQIPATTLSTAGRLVVIREKRRGNGGHALRAPGGEEDIEAVTVDDALLRTVVYGDPMMHMMSLYKRRVEVLATRAVTAGGY